MNKLELIETLENECRLSKKDAAAIVDLFFDKMFGNYPAYWDKNLQGWDRLRFITNVMTRMRYLDSSGALELDIKCPPGKQPTGFHPWYSVECKRKASWKVFYGHWSTLGLHWQNNAICLDSGCLWGGELTAARIDIPKLQFISQTCRKTRNLLIKKILIDFILLLRKPGVVSRANNGQTPCKYFE